MMPTTSGEMAYFILAVEFGLLALTFGVMFFRRADSKATAPVVRETSTPVTPDQRRATLAELLRDTFQLADDQVDDVLRDFSRREHAFYSMLLILHLGRGGKSIDDVPRELSRAIAPWWRLPSIPAPDETDFFAEDTLSKAPHVEAKQVLDELLAEYRKAFGVAPVQEAPQAVAEEPASHGDDLLSLDENVESIAEAAPVAEEVQPVAASDADIIALDADGDEEPAPPANQVTPSDLDFLMENLATDYPQQSAAA